MVLIPCSDGCFYVENKRSCEQSAGYDLPWMMYGLWAAKAPPFLGVFFCQSTIAIVV